MGSIQGKLAALAFASKAAGFSDSTDYFHLRKMFKGWSRVLGAPRDTRVPSSPDILKGLTAQWGLLCKSSAFEVALFHAAALVAFLGAFRISKLVAESCHDASWQALHFADVQCGQEGIQLLLRFSKTNQLGRGSLISLSPCLDPDLCPVLVLCSYLALRGQGDGCLFIHEDGTPLTKFQFWSVTRRALDGLGLSGCQFGSHSFRIGAATTAATMGYTRSDVQWIGR